MQTKSDTRKRFSSSHDTIWLIFLICAAASFSPSLTSYLFLSFTGLNFPLGIIIFGVFLLLALGYLFTGNINRYGARAFFFVLFIIFLICLTSLWSPSTVYLQSKLPTVLIFPPFLFLVGFLIASTGHLRQFSYALVGMGIIVAAAALIFGSEFLRGTHGTEGDDFSRLYQSMSRILATGAVVAFALAVGTQKIGLKTLAYIVSAVLAFEVLFTGGRVGILIIIFAVPMIYISKMKPFYMVFSTVLITVISYFVFVYLDPIDFIHAAWPGELPRTLQRILYEISTQADTRYELLDRQNLWRLAYEVWNEHPIIGVGLAGFPVSAGIGDMPGVYPHNIIMELAAETGIIGLSIFLLMISRLLLASPLVRVLTSDRSLAVAIFSAGLGASMVISDLGLQRELFMGLGLIYGLKFPDSAR